MNSSKNRSAVALPSGNGAPSSQIILYTTDDGRSQIALYAADGGVWLNQAQLAELFDTSRTNIAMHIRNILEEGELFELSVCKKFLQTAADGKNYQVEFYSLPMIATQDMAILQGGGSVSNETMENAVRQTYETFDARRKAAAARAADDADLKTLEKSIDNRKK